MVSSELAPTPSLVRNVDWDGRDTDVVLWTSSRPPGQDRDRKRAFRTPNVVFRYDGKRCWTDVLE